MTAVLLYAVSALSGALFMGGSLWLAFFVARGGHGRKAASQEQSGEFALELKWFKVKSSYPMLGMALVGAGLIVYPIYSVSTSGIQPVDVRGQLIIEPDAAVEDVLVKLMLGPWDVSTDSDGKVATTVYPDAKRYRVEVRAPGRPTLVKTVTVTGMGVVDIGDLKVAPPVVDYAPVPLAPAGGD